MYVDPFGYLGALQIWQIENNEWHFTDWHWIHKGTYAKVLTLARKPPATVDPTRNQFWMPRNAPCTSPACLDSKLPCPSGGFHRGHSRFFFGSTQNTKKNGNNLATWHPVAPRTALKTTHPTLLSAPHKPWHQKIGDWRVQKLGFEIVNLSATPESFRGGSVASTTSAFDLKFQFLCFYEPWNHAIIDACSSCI